MMCEIRREEVKGGKERSLCLCLCVCTYLLYNIEYISTLLYSTLLSSVAPSSKTKLPRCKLPNAVPMYISSNHPTRKCSLCGVSIPSLAS